MIISVINRSKGTLTKSAVSRVVRAVNKQIRRDFEPFWGMGCKLRVVADEPITSEGGLAMQDSCVIYLQTEIDAEGALGYHDANHAGIPYGVVCTELSEQMGEPWSVTFSHEVLELVGDPQANLLAMGPHPKDRKKNVFHWFEMCDAVQAASYEIDEVAVSNFVLPFYFTPGAQDGRNDFMDSGLKSFGVNPGGYVGFYDPELGGSDTYQRASDKLSAKRFALKQQLGPARRATKYRINTVGPAPVLPRANKKSSR